MKLVEFFVNMGLSIYAKDNNKKNTLHFACQSGSNELVQYLVPKNVGVNAKDSKTTLHFACEGGSKTLVEYLIENGLHFDARDKADKAPLHCAT